MEKFPRIMVAGLGGDSGKTILSCGLLNHFRNSGLRTAPFKKGPDYIDPAWLRLASGSDVRNLDTFLMTEESVLRSFTNHALHKQISVIEGNRGLHDGFDEKGTHSTAQLAKLLRTPVILTFSARKVTRTVAAYVLGCREMDKEVSIAAVVLNQTAGERHANIAGKAIEEETGIPVVGIIPKHRKKEILPSRHLGLITPAEYKFASEAIAEAGRMISDNVDTSAILEIAGKAHDLELMPEKAVERSGEGLRIGYLIDRAFNFYYPENLEALAKRGAELIKISTFEDKKLPEIDCLYMGGGFPETNAEEISANTELMKSIAVEIEKGLPVYAECGGLIYLSGTLTFEENNYPMCGIFPLKIKMERKPQGHGYSIMKVTGDNPFFKKGLEIKGHEFHYTRIAEVTGDTKPALDVLRGSGALPGKDGLVYKNVFAAYMHIHASSSEDWANGMVKAAITYKEKNGA